MKAAIMQPYFFPYIGYFQLMAAVDVFVVYDNIKYTKKGWINRNRILQNGKEAVFSLPLKGGSDYLDVRDRELSADIDRGKLLDQVRNAYRRAPQFAQTFPVVEQVLRYEATNLFAFLLHSLVRIRDHLGVAAEIRTSSSLPIDHGLKSQDKVLALCKAVGASTYVNAIGGVDLYSAASFREQGIELKFVKSKPCEYEQFDDPFVPWLSIIDVLMFNPIDDVKNRIANDYELI